MVSQLSLWVALIQILSATCLYQHCQHTEQTTSKLEEKWDRYGYRRQEYVDHVSSVQYECDNVTLPLNNLNVVICENCPSTLVLQSLTNTTIPPLSFTDCNFLNEIYMNNTGVKEILPAAFSSVSRLRRLDLSKNEISQIPDGLLNSLTELEVLDFSSNKLETLSKHFLIGLQKLQLLNLSCNHLTEFDVSIFHTFENIQFDLSFNSLKTFNFKSLFGSVQYYNLSHNHIEEISGCFSNVNIVKLDNNKLENVNNISCDENSSRISKLDLGYNLLSRLSNGIFDHTTSLEYLYLEHNNISMLQPDIFGKLSNLNVLNLSSNHLSDFQHGVFDHVQLLRRLDLSDNELLTTKRYFHSLSSLQSLNLNNNHMKILDSSQLILDLPSLEIISLDRNNFFCEQLINIVQNFKKANITVLQGTTKSSSNINGIACNASNTLDVVSSGSDDNSEKKASLLLGIEHLLQKYKNDEKSMFNFFNAGFKESNFYKYLESFKRDDSMRFNETDIVSYFNKNFKNAEFFKFFEDYKQPAAATNNSLIDFFNKDFKNSIFVQYLEKLQDADRFLCDDFDKSIFFNFFNNDFRNTNFYRYLENISTSRNIVNNVETEDPKVGKFVDLSVENHRDNYYGILIVFLILQTLLIFVATVSTIISLKLYYVLSKNSYRNKEQVELMAP